MHTRKRHIEEILKKRAKIFPVLGVLGPRQVGKSTFLMYQWSEENRANYITFDEKEVAQRAKRAPAQLLLADTADQTIHLIIDEAQKVPHIFDSIKALVDKKRRNGAFTLSASTEFSSKSGVRESLAGRMGTTRLYPMTLAELSNQDFIAPWVSFNFERSPLRQAPSQSKAIELWLERGGMPIFCRLSDVDERIGLINSWLEAICYKDLKQLKDADYDSDIAYQLMLFLSTESNLSFTKIAEELGTTATIIKKHISVLESLFLIYKIPAFESPRRRPVYTIFDAGVYNALRGGKSTLVSRLE